MLRMRNHNFLFTELCSLLLTSVKQIHLWEGYKFLPNLRNMELYGFEKLVVTPDFDGLPNLETFTIYRCDCLEEVHPSIARLERLVLLCIRGGYCLKKFPPITRLNKLETLTFVACPTLLFKISDTQQQNMDDNSGKEVASYKKTFTNSCVTCWTCGCSNLGGLQCCLEEPCLLPNNIGLRFLYRSLRELDLGQCELGDEYIGSCVWELPNLQELSLAANNFSRLNFSLLKLPRLKWLNLAACFNLVELSGLPSSIAVVIANGCSSLESFGDISNCKWLWKVSLQYWDKTLGGDILLDSMLRGNAVMDHFISVVLSGKCLLQNQIIPKGFVVGGKTCELHLPDGWYNDFCGFLVCIVTDIECPRITIIIKRDVDGEDSRFDFWQESNEALEPEYIKTTTYIGYVSFNSLKHITWSTSSYNIISFSLEETYRNPLAIKSYVGAVLVPKKSKGDQVQTTDFSEFWYTGREHRKTFSIQHDSQPSIKILWHPFY
ncbi:unnamed protein product [Lactuca virosa]|uniref:Leucine-rich repeat domain, L domain-containing protein n=1 Tax=Lactuca virosa TaxID=75947 RepID=A0AAU9MYW2_9ASTR|nr:unnamed protein product [Lactuca virosa]